MLIGSGVHPGRNLLGTGEGRGGEGVKGLDCQADHSPPSSAKVKNGWHYTSTPVCLHGLYKVNFAFVGIQI